MPAPVLSGIESFLFEQTGITVWDGEVMREGEDEKPVPFPVLRAVMPESGFQRTWSFEDPYSDDGTVDVQVWDVSKGKVESLIDVIEGLLATEENWRAINLGSTDLGAAGKYSVYSLLLDRWTLIQEEGARTKDNQLIYRGDMHYSVGVHGAVATR